MGMKRDEPALLAKVNGSLKAMDDNGTIDKIWDTGLGQIPNTKWCVKSAYSHCLT